MNIKNFKHKVINKNKPPCSRAEVQREKIFKSEDKKF